MDRGCKINKYCKQSFCGMRTLSCRVNSVMVQWYKKKRTVKLSKVNNLFNLVGVCLCNGEERHE